MLLFSEQTRSWLQDPHCPLCMAIGARGRSPSQRGTPSKGQRRQTAPHLHLPTNSFPCPMLPGGSSSLSQLQATCGASCARRPQVWIRYLHPTCELWLHTAETTLPRSCTAWPLSGKCSLPCLQRRGEHETKLKRLAEQWPAPAPSLRLHQGKPSSIMLVLSQRIPPHPGPGTCQNHRASLALPPN